MERELKNIKFFELPSSFENDVIERLRGIKRKRKRAKIVALPLIFIVILTFLSLIFFNFNPEKETPRNTALSMKETYTEQLPAAIYIEVIPVKDLEKENRYLIEFVKEKEEKIYAF